MKSLLLVFFIVMAVMTNSLAEPVGDPAKAKPKMMHHRGEKMVTVSLDDSSEAMLWKPDLSTIPLSIQGGKIKLPRTGVDNYHAIVAKQQLGNTEKVVIRYVYKHGKPSGHSTSELTKANKADLEVVPDPVPREHNQYFSQQVWDFIIRFKGEVLTQHPVTLTTENGTTLLQESDDEGRVSFKLPSDFDNIVIGKRDERMAVMHITTQVIEGEQRWVTQLDANYSVSESFWRLTFLGVLVMVIGVILGTVFIKSKGKRVEVRKKR